jgi:hypothetical protein
MLLLGSVIRVPGRHWDSDLNRCCLVVPLLVLIFRDLVELVRGCALRPISICLVNLQQGNQSIHNVDLLAMLYSIGSSIMDDLGGLYLKGIGEGSQRGNWLSVGLLVLVHCITRPRIYNHATERVE